MPKRFHNLTACEKADKFFVYWERIARKGEVSPLSLLERMMINNFAEWCDEEELKSRERLAESTARLKKGI